MVGCSISGIRTAAVTRYVPGHDAWLSSTAWRVTSAFRGSGRRRRNISVTIKRAGHATTADSHKARRGAGGRSRRTLSDLSSPALAVGLAHFAMAAPALASVPVLFVGVAKLSCRRRPLTPVFTRLISTNSGSTLQIPYPTEIFLLPMTHFSCTVRACVAPSLPADASSDGARRMCHRQQRKSPLGKEFVKCCLN